MPALRMHKIARRFFTAPEADALCACPPEEITEAFFDLWVRKEAYVKLTGVGLAGMGSLCTLDGSVRFIRPDGVPDGYAAAVCVFK